MTQGSDQPMDARPEAASRTAPASLLTGLDRRSCTLPVARGISWSALEHALRAEGLTLGWGPPLGPAECLLTLLEQGQDALGSGLYGTPIQNVAGIEARLGTGELASTLTVPRSAAGPDFKHLVLGQAGRFGRLERAVLRVYPLPACQVRFHWEARNLAEGLEMLALSLQQGIAPALACAVPLREGPAASARCGLLLSGDVGRVAAKRVVIERFLAKSGRARQVVAETLEPSSAGASPSSAVTGVLSVLGEGTPSRTRLESLRGIQDPAWQVAGSWRQLLDASKRLGELPSLKGVLALGHERALGVLGSEAEGAKWRSHLRRNVSSSQPTSYPVQCAATLETLLTLCDVGG